MSQSRALSLVEAIANVFVGFLVSVLANIIVLPLFGYPVSVGHSFGIAVVFTAISLVRSYVLRRAFNKIRH